MWSESTSSAQNGGVTMKRHENVLISRRNYRDTRDYLTYCDEVLHAAPGSVRLYRTALDHLLRWATDVPFVRAADLRPTLPRYLSAAGNSLSYQKKLLEICRSFLTWAEERHPDRYPNRTFIETIRPVQQNEPAVPHRELYTLDDMLRLAATPVNGLTEERSRAAACFLFLSAMRVSAFTSLPLLAIDLTAYEVKQWPVLGVKTKNRKAATTYLLSSMEVEPLLDIVRDWDTKVRRCLPPSAPWYALLDRTGETFAAEQTPGHTRSKNLSLHLQTLCARAGIPYRSPHKFRHGFAVYALPKCHTMEDFKAVSQNLMHEQIGTTDAIYSIMLNNQVADRIAALGQERKETARLLEEFLRLINH